MGKKKCPLCKRKQRNGTPYCQRHSLANGIIPSVPRLGKKSQKIRRSETRRSPRLQTAPFVTVGMMKSDEKTGNNGVTPLPEIVKKIRRWAYMVLVDCGITDRDRCCRTIVSIDDADEKYEGRRYQPSEVIGKLADTLTRHVLGQIKKDDLPNLASADNFRNLEMDVVYAPPNRPCHTTRKWHRDVDTPKGDYTFFLLLDSNDPTGGATEFWPNSDKYRFEEKCPNRYLPSSVETVKFYGPIGTLGIWGGQVVHRALPNSNETQGRAALVWTVSPQR